MIDDEDRPGEDGVTGGRLGVLRRELDALPRHQREQLGLPATPDPSGAILRSEAARRALQRGAVVVAAGSAVLAVVLEVLGSVPWQAGTGVPQSVDLPEGLGRGVAVALLPAVVLLLALVVPRRWSASSPAAADHLALGTAVLVSASTAVGFWSTGLFHVPAALLLW